jgi:hypothetical protein
LLTSASRDTTDTGYSEPRDLNPDSIDISDDEQQVTSTPLLHPGQISPPGSEGLGGSDESLRSSLSDPGESFTPDCNGSSVKTGDMINNSKIHGKNGIIYSPMAQKYPENLDHNLVENQSGVNV